MIRRDFIRNGVLVGATAAVGGFNLSDIPLSATENRNEHSFQMHYAPHFGMFENHAGKDLVDQLKFAAGQGFTAWEDNGMKDRPVGLQEKIATTMADLNMQMGVFVAHKIYWKEPNLASGDTDKRNEFLDDIRESVDVAKRVNAKWITVVPGFTDLSKKMGYQTTNVVASLKAASEILEPNGLIMVLEPLNFRDHPGLFLKEIPQAYEICKAVNSPSCKILFDIYHQQITEGNLIPNIDLAWDEIGYFQIGDNPGRKEPTTGEINYKNVFKHIYSKGYDGILGMEHGNSQPGKEGEQTLIKAYLEVDSFEV